MTDLFARLLLGYVLALPFIVPLIVNSSASLTTHTVLVRMEAPVPGHLQLFYDAGEGFSEARSTAAEIHVGSGATDYRLPLPAGRYAQLRIDPGTLAGRYVIERVAILQADETVRREIPLETLTPGGSVKLEHSPGRLIVQTIEGLSDPQLLFRPARPLIIPREIFNRRDLSLAGSVMMWWLAGIGVVWLVERLSRPGHDALRRRLTRATTLCEARPHLAIWCVAVAATVASAYPVIFMGKSLVSPNNGVMRLLYQEVPFTPGSTDTEIEDVRGNDVGATMVQSIPHALIQREAIAQGEVPLWNRYHSAGLPLWSQGLSYLFDPLHWIALSVSDPALAWDFTFLAHRVVFAAGVGMAAMAATGSLFPALLVVFVTPFVGVYTFRLNHPALFALTYAPWVLLAWFRLAHANHEREIGRAAVLLSIASALLLFASVPKEGAMMLLGVQGAGVLTVLLSAATGRQRMMRLGAAVAAGICVILITAPHWLNFLDTLRQSFTAYDSPYAALGDRSYLVGLFLGPLAPGMVRPGLHLLALVLLVACVTSPRRLFEQRPVAVCAGVGMGLLAAALGVVPESVLLAIPFVKSIGHVHDVFITAAVPLLLVASAAGVGILGASRWRAYLTVFVVGLCGAWFYAGIRHIARDDAFEPWAVLIVIPLAVGVPIAVHAARRQGSRLLPLIAATLAAVVLVLPGGLHAESGLANLDLLIFQPRPRVDLLALSPAVETLHAQTTDPVRAAGIDWTLHSGSQRYYRLEGIGGPDPLGSANYRDLLDAARIHRVMTWFTDIPMDDAPRLGTLLDVLNVGFLLARNDRAPVGFDEVPLGKPDRIRLGRRSSVWPRAFFVDGVSTHVDAADFLRLAAAAGKPMAAVQAGDDRALRAVHAYVKASGVVIPAQDYRLTANTTGFHLKTTSAGVAVLGETYLADDFRATVNGQPTEYFRINQAFKGLIVPGAGDWDVRFEYRPQYWDRSLAAAAIGVALLALMAVTAFSAGRTGT